MRKMSKFMNSVEFLNKNNNQTETFFLYSETMWLQLKSFVDLHVFLFQEKGIEFMIILWGSGKNPKEYLD